MRWRYVILGVLLAVPAATAIQHWPQLPIYRIPAEDRYLIGDDRKNGELLFFYCSTNEARPPAIERYDAANGQLKKSVELNCKKLGLQRSGFWVRVSDDGKVVTWVAGQYLPWQSTNYGADFVTSLFSSVDTDDCHFATFDAVTGQFLCHKSEQPIPRHVNVSPDGKYVATVLLESSGRDETNIGAGQLSIYNTESLDQSPAVNFAGRFDETFTTCFSPDSRYLLFKRVSSRESASSLKLINLQSGKIERTFELPPERILDEWRPNELISFESLPPNGTRCGRYRHAFDGVTLGSGTIDPLLEIPHPLTMSPNRQWDHDTWISQFEYRNPEYAPWIKLIARIEEVSGLQVCPREWTTPLAGVARIVDRSTKSNRFEKQVPSINSCRFVINGAYLVIGGKDPWSVRAIPGTAPTNSPPAIPPFEIYRTDGWPRWIWTMLGAGALLLIFLLLARWRHVTVRRKCT